MPDIKLTYFDLKARGETARLILAYAGVAYEDERVEIGGGGSGVQVILQGL